ncbi:MAG: hypothetical protein H7308_16595 [Chthonomonadaceae bacterium]|nr:hypothetical protein [Chthonomonadaceae bacterium]
MLNLAENAGFDALLTTDKNIPYQQKMPGRNLAIIILRAVNNRAGTLILLLPQSETILLSLESGYVYRVEVPASE